MRTFARLLCTGFSVGAAMALGSCAGDDSTVTSNSGGSSSSSGGSNAAAGATSAGGSNASGGSTGGSGGSSNGSGGNAGAAGSAGSTAGSGGSPTSDAGGTDAAAADPCDTALFCEKFDNYAAVTSIAQNQKFGPWHAALQTGATMKLDGTHKISGANALHVHIDNAVTAGGRLFSDGNQPIFASKPTHVYGRMMMYIDPNGTSIHWTFFGVNGNVEPSSPEVGRNASYIMSALLPKSGLNTYSFVYGLSSTGDNMGNNAYHDCSQKSAVAMPSTWACISFEMDSVARKLRMYKDGAVAPILSIDDHGDGCVAPTVVTSPWYGPSINQLFVGAWSFHQMNAPLDVWIDDLVVDTKPVACPPQ